MTYRNDLSALVARKTALETEVRDRQRELDEATRLVDEVEARTRLPVLDNIKVAEPCTARWDKMTGDDRVRACGDCNKNVYNLSSLTRDEAEALIIEKAGKLCVRYFQRADGTVMFQDCPVGVKRRRRRRLFAAGVAASIAGASFSYVRARANEGCERLGERVGLEGRPMMGAIAPPPSQPGIEQPPTYAQPPTHVSPPSPPMHMTVGKLALPHDLVPTHKPGKPPQR